MTKEPTPLQTPDQEKKIGNEPETHPIQTPDQEKHTGDGPSPQLPKDKV